MQLDRINELKENLKYNKSTGVFKHNININAPLIPFQTRNPERVKFERGFKGILGELSRIIVDKNTFKGIDVNEMLEDIISKIEISEEDIPYLKAIIKDYLINESDEINILHPHLFQYTSLTEGKQSVGEEAVALFLRDVLIVNNSKIYDFFENKDTKHIIMKLILCQLKALEPKTKERKYIGKLPFVTKVFQEDIEFLCTNTDFLTKNLDQILAYYYFYYCAQLCIKLSKGFKANYTLADPIYYLLDWESVSKNRKTIDMGYKYIKKHSRDLLIHINLLEHFNTLCGRRGKTLGELKCDIDNNLTNSQLILQEIYYWINEYRELKGLEPVCITPISFEVLAKQHYNSLSEIIDQAPISRYAKNLEEIGKKYFLKSRGSYGYVLNINQDMLLIITAMCIKEEKITLKQLFLEYEKRGLYFDRYSKEEIVSTFNKLNLIDKKSDSGDAQYVKSIL